MLKESLYSAKALSWWTGKCSKQDSSYSGALFPHNPISVSPENQPGKMLTLMFNHRKKKQPTVIFIGTEVPLPAQQIWREYNFSTGIWPAQVTFLRGEKTCQMVSSSHSQHLCSRLRFESNNLSSSHSPACH